VNLAELRREREMEHWEFLLQKEGDRSWLPLDSPDVEILEGRYRLVARSHHANAAIDIRIAHLATEAVPPKRRVQKRACRTNHDGLMVVIPFTHLEPGLWELCCSPADLMSDLIAGAQPYAVKLQVVAREFEEEWDPDWTSPPQTLTETTFTDIAALHSTASAHPAQPNQPELATHTQQDAVTVAPTADTPSLSDTERLQLPDIATNDRRVDLPPEVAEILGASMERLFQIAEQMSEQLVDDVLQDLDLTAIADAPVDAVEPVVAPEQTTIAPMPSDPDESTAKSNARLLMGYTLAANEAFALKLDQTAFMAARGEVITLSGQVTIAAMPVRPLSGTTAPLTPPLEAGIGNPWESDGALNLLGAIAQELQLCLRDPQSLQVVASDRQPLPQPSFPCPFTFSFSLPDAFATHLVLGEVLLCGTLAEQTEAAIALTTQAFSITVDPNALVGELSKLHEALTTEIEDEERIDLPLELSSRLKPAAPQLDFSFLDEAAPEAPVARSPHFPSLAGQPLPPQLYQPDPEQSRSKSLNLPAFKLITEPLPAASTDPETTAQQPEIESIAADEADSMVDSLVETAQVPSDQVTITASTAASAATANGAASETVVAIPDEANTDSSNQLPLDLPSPTHMAFQSLKLQDRFLTRLTSLATDTELSALLKASLTPGSPAIEVPTAPSQAETRSLSEEIVVDDEPLPSQRQSKPTAPAQQAPLEEQPTPLLLPADEPVPMPILEVITGELTAGKPINLRVKLPNLLPRIYVKFWVLDRQTRSLLDGPRWLVDFLPNGLGDLEAMTPLTVPFGSVELRFEAIAVEMHTQRESHKVTVDRAVVPPDLPVVSLDAFNDQV